ncbi:MAG: sensor histidine kinase [Spirochaetia bacterium]
MIERVLTNLIETSIKHTPSEGTVVISIKQENGSVITCITDNGSGISENDLPRIFEMFYIGDTSRSRSKRGSGLGLGICRRIIGLHGGKIWAESTPGKGSTFTFSLPRDPAANKIGNS